MSKLRSPVFLKRLRMSHARCRRRGSTHPSWTLCVKSPRLIIPAYLSVIMNGASQYIVNMHGAASSLQPYVSNQRFFDVHRGFVWPYSCLLLASVCFYFLGVVDLPSCPSAPQKQRFQIRHSIIFEKATFYIWWWSWKRFGALLGFWRSWRSLGRPLGAPYRPKSGDTHWHALAKCVLELLILSLDPVLSLFLSCRSFLGPFSWIRRTSQLKTSSLIRISMTSHLKTWFLKPDNLYFYYVWWMS